mgnify:CR=1 FL=1
MHPAGPDLHALLALPPLRVLDLGDRGGGERRSRTIVVSSFMPTDGALSERVRDRSSRQKARQESRGTPRQRRSSSDSVTRASTRSVAERRKADASSALCRQRAGQTLRRRARLTLQRDASRAGCLSRQPTARAPRTPTSWPQPGSPGKPSTLYRPARASRGIDGKRHAGQRARRHPRRKVTPAAIALHHVTAADALGEILVQRADHLPLPPRRQKRKRRQWRSASSASNSIIGQTTTPVMVSSARSAAVETGRAGRQGTSSVL